MVACSSVCRWTDRRAGCLAKLPQKTQTGICSESRVSGVDTSYYVAANLYCFACHAGSWREVAYHGDSMLRPIASYEVAWLARVLVGVSRAINNSLGLSAVPEPTPDEPPETIVQVGVSKGSLCISGVLLAGLHCDCAAAVGEACV